MHTRNLRQIYWYTLSEPFDLPMLKELLSVNTDGIFLCYTWIPRMFQVC